MHDTAIDKIKLILRSQKQNIFKIALIRTFLTIRHFMLHRFHVHFAVKATNLAYVCMRM